MSELAASPALEHAASPVRSLLKSLSPAVRDAIRPHEPLWRYTTLRVGGPAELYYRADNIDDLAEIAAAAQCLDLPYFLLGGGSNVCISDRGVRGLVIHKRCER